MPLIIGEFRDAKPPIYPEGYWTERRFETVEEWQKDFLKLNPGMFVPMPAMDELGIRVYKFISKKVGEDDRLFAVKKPA